MQLSMFRYPDAIWLFALSRHRLSAGWHQFCPGVGPPSGCFCPT